MRTVNSFHQQYEASNFFALKRILNTNLNGKHEPVKKG